MAALEAEPRRVVNAIGTCPEGAAGGLHGRGHFGAHGRPFAAQPTRLGTCRIEHFRERVGRFLSDGHAPTERKGPACTPRDVTAPSGHLRVRCWDYGCGISTHHRVAPPTSDLALTPALTPCSDPLGGLCPVSCGRLFSRSIIEKSRRAIEKSPAPTRT